MRFIVIRALLDRLRRDNRGATIIIFAIVLIPMLALAGGAIDFWRAYVVKTKMQSALDAAVLSAASTPGMTDEERVAFAKQVFAANYPADQVGAPGQPQITISSEGVITGDIDTNLDTLVLGLIGLDDLDIGSFAQVKSASIGSGEVVLVLDYSGSMSSSGKYQDMRDAATELINILSEEGSNSNVKFGLVPFSEHVYGSMESDFVVNETPGGTWTNCTRDRKWSYNIQDVTPLSGVNDSKWGMECAAGGGGEEDEGEEGGGGACDPYAICSNYTSRNLVIQPLTDNHGALISQLGSMSPYANTHISLGLAMGWHLLSPNPPWEEGVAYGTSNVLKAIVLLTDGRQTTPGWGTGGSKSVGQAETNLEDMCTAIKAQDVTVITVAFDLDDSATRDRLQNCATSPSFFFFDVNTGTELVAVFKAIAGQLAGEMHLTK